MPSLTGLEHLTELGIGGSQLGQNNLNIPSSIGIDQPNLLLLDFRRGHWRCIGITRRYLLNILRPTKQLLELILIELHLRIINFLPNGSSDFIHRHRRDVAGFHGFGGLAFGFYFAGGKGEAQAQPGRRWQ